jgi:parallel beta-helix repeat protein
MLAHILCLSALKDWEKKVKNLFFVAAAFLLLATPCYSEIIIVDNDWPYDFNNIQAAIEYSSNGDFIFVFPGTYKGPGNRDISFLGKAITVRSIDPTDPYFVAQTTIDCNHLGQGFNFTSGEDANSILSGFTITNASNAIRCSGSSPTITNCIITKNASPVNGAIYCSGNGSPIITNCTITSNTGSGIHCEYGTPIVADCIISGNTGYGRSGDGGGISVLNGLCLIYNSVINGNTSGNGRGGGIYCAGNSQFTSTNCTITGNSAKYDGGGIFSSSSGISKVTNCTLSGNSAKRHGGGICLASSSLSIFVTSSIIWGNADSNGTGQSAQVCSGKPDVWFSCIQDDNPNDTNIPFGDENFNIDDDPCFIEPGYWVDANDPNITVEPNDPNAVWLEGDYHLLFTSPCVETGDPYFNYNPGDIDIDGQPRLMGLCVDMGVDEVELSVIVVTKPQGGVAWIAGSTHEIKWESYGITSTVDIYYSDNSGTDWIIIENSVTNTGSFTWHLPDAIDSNHCLISVEPNVPPVFHLICAPSGLFTIRPDSKWKSLGGDFDRSGLSQNYGPELGCVKWKFHTNGPVSASPTIGAGSRVHLSCEDGNVYTLDANGLLLWSYDTNSPLLSAPSIGPDGSVYVGAENGKLYAIDIDGYLRWTHNTGGPIYSSPAVSTDNYVFACSQYGTLYALAQDGSELWSFETGGVGIATGAIFASPAIDPNGTIYIAGLYDPNLYALDPNDGSIKWICTFLDPCEPNGLKLRPFASPVVAPNGTIYLALLCNHKRLIETYGGGYWYDSKLYAIDSNNGSIIWATNMTKTATQEEKLFGPPEPNYWFRKYYAYVPQGAPLYPYTATDYLGRYYVRYYRVSNSSWSESALGPDGTIYVSFDDQYLRAVDPNGSIKWVTSLGWLGGFTMTVGSDGLIYAASDDGYLYVIDPTGKEIARFKGYDGLSFPVITADNTMIVCDANNTVWAIGGSGCEGQPAALHRPEDLNADWSMNFIDFAVMAAGWLDCTDTSLDPITKTPYCDDPGNEIFLKSDINRDQYVDLADLAGLANRWLTQE